MRRLLLLVATLALVAAACGSGGDAVKAADGSSTSSSSTTSSTLVRGHDPNERALVENGVLHLGDLPAGFTQEPPDEEGDDEFDAMTAKVPECSGLKEQVEGRSTAEAKSPDFSYGDDVKVSNDVELFATTAVLDEVMGLIPAPDTVTCFEQALQAGLDQRMDEEPGSEVRGMHVTGEPMSVPAYGDGAVGIQFTVAVDVGQTVNLYFQLVGVKIGHTLTTYSFMDSDAHMLGSLRDEIIRTTSDRLRAT